MELRVPFSESNSRHRICPSCKHSLETHKFVTILRPGCTGLDSNSLTTKCNCLYYMDAYSMLALTTVKAISNSHYAFPLDHFTKLVFLPESWT